MCLELTLGSHPHNMFIRRQPYRQESIACLFM